MQPTSVSVWNFVFPILVSVWFGLLQKMLKRGYNGVLNSKFTSFHSLKSFIFYSTSVPSKDGVTTPPILDYLVNSVGFSEKEAHAILTKVSPSFLSTKKSEPVVNFLKQSGFDDTHIRKVIFSFPDVLRNNVDTTLTPKIRAFQNVGFSGSDLGLILSRHPGALSRGVESHIIPALELLKSLFGEKEHLVEGMLQTKSPRLLSPDIFKNVPANIKLLRKYDLLGVVRSPGFKMLLMRRGFLFGSTQWVKKTLKEVEQKLHIPRKSSMFVYGVCALTRKSDIKIESWVDVLRRFEWSEIDIWELLRRHPVRLSLHENTLDLKLRYFMEELGYESEYLAKNGAMLQYRMEKRVAPRVAVMQTLKDRDLLKRYISIHTFLLMAETKFLKKFVLPYQKILPELFDNYTRAVGYTLSQLTHL